MVKFTLEGLDEVIRTLEKLTNHELRGIYKTAVYSVAAEVLRAAIPITPKKTGVLRASSSIRSTRSGKFGAQAKLSFSANYALEVHEQTGVYHAPPTVAKFLEKSVNKVGPKQELIYARFFKEVLGGDD